MTEINKKRPRPMLNNFRHVIFKRGSFHIEYSTNIDGSESKVLNIFSQKQIKQITEKHFKLQNTLEYQNIPLGVDKTRKDEIVKNLNMLMPDEAKLFWSQLPEKVADKDKTFKFKKQRK
jgi:hypothetical protein